jgi:hypothetical protein
MGKPKVIRMFDRDEIDTWFDDETLHNRMLWWLRSNGITPTEASSAYPLIIEEVRGVAQIRYMRFVRSERGHIQIRTDADLPLVEEVVVPMVVPLP